ncbi:MAG: type II secretion system protein N [Gammaproteobacteria bacterium]
MRGWFQAAGTAARSLPGRLHPQRLARAAPLAALIAALACLGAVGAWHAPRLRAPAPVPIEDAVDTAPRPRPAPADYSRLATLRLFGAPAQARVAAADAPETADTTLQLKGTLHADGAGPARAILALSGAPDRVYAPGDELAGGAVLREVQRDRIVIERDGRLESVRLPKPGGAGTGPAQAGLPQPVSGDAEEIANQYS